VWKGETVADIPLGPLADEAPLYERPYAIPKPAEPLTDIPENTDIAADLLKLMASPNLASRRWVWEQYDQSVGADTVQRPGGDAAVVRIHGSKKALAITTDCTPRYCYADPVEGGKQAVAEAYRNLCAVGAKPLAITNCLNFGNPQRPEIMGQFVGCIEGMAEACRALEFPVVSGNVSLYNETKNDDGTSLAILPTPAIGGVGLLEDWEKSATIGFKSEGEDIIVVGGTGAFWDDRACDWGSIGQSLWLREIHGLAAGSPPQVDLHSERKAGDLVRQLISAGLVSAVHDVGDGGVLVAVAEMALASNIGADVEYDPEYAQFHLFGEEQGRFVITTFDWDNVRERLERSGLVFWNLGQTAGRNLSFVHDGDPGTVVADIPLADLRAAHEGFFPRLMGSELSPEL
jgi:phosphoribosylformylglycinamidine synthase II